MLSKNYQERGHLRLILSVKYLHIEFCGRSGAILHNQHVTSFCDS